MPTAIVVLTIANSLLAAAVMSLWAQLHGKLRAAYACLGLLLGPFALLMLLLDVRSNRASIGA